MISTKRKCIFVLGMHRSGTSAMAGLLHHTSISLGQDLMEPTIFNEKGYYENNKIFFLNEEILGDLGVSWHSSYLLAGDWGLIEDLFDKYYVSIVKIIESEFLESPIIAIKDPRLCVLLPIWLLAMRQMNLDYACIIMLRHPVEVLESLSARDGFTPEVCEVLWTDYLLNAERVTRNTKRLFIGYNDILDNPIITLKRIEGLIGEPLVKFDKTQKIVEDYIEPKLKHYSHNPSLIKSSGLGQATLSLWNLLNQCKETVSSLELKRFDRFLRLHKKSCSMYGRAFAHDLEQVLEEKNMIVLEIEKQNDLLKNKVLELATSHEEAEALRTVHGELEQRLSIKEIAIIQQNERISMLENTILDKNQVIEIHEKKIQDLNNTILDKIHDLNLQKEEDLSKISDLERELHLNQDLLANSLELLQSLRTHCQNIDLDRRNLRESISFQLGWYLTRPPAVLLNLLRKWTMGFKLLRLSPILMWSIFRSPISLIKKLNYGNYRILMNALRTEPVGDIIWNLKNLLKRGNNRILGHKTVSGQDQYQRLLEKITLSPEEVKYAKKECKDFHFKPLISIITPVFNTDPRHLEKCILSVLSQYYERWELCIYDDASNSKDTLECLKRWHKVDPRIKISFGSSNLHISMASNVAIRMSKGDFVGLLDHDDELTPDALYQVVKLLNRKSHVDFIYSDEDKIDQDDRLCDPHFKSDFNLDLFLSHNYICHFSVIRKSIGDQVGWFRSGLEGSQDYDLFLRIIDKTRRIEHISKVLYHWRKSPGSTALDRSNKNYVNQSSKIALTEYLERNGIKGFVSNGLFNGSWRIRRELGSSKLVSIIIPFKDEVEVLSQCLKSLFSKTQYSNYEVLLISNNSEEKTTFDYLKKVSEENEQVTYYEYNIPFNFSKINNWAAQKAMGDVLLFLNNDTEAICDGWLVAMLEHIQRNEVGAVGAKLFYPNMTVQHAGVVVGIGGVAAHVHNNFPHSALGYFGRASIIQNLSACTGACLMVKKSVFEEVGGFEENGLEIAFNDIDLCLKVRELGYLIVYTPYAQLIHHESLTRGYEDTPKKKLRFNKEVIFFQNKWKRILDEGDPFYNHNLSLERTDFGLRI